MYIVHVSDLHIREDSLEYFRHSWKDLICKLSKYKDYIIIVTGDVFESPKPQYNEICEFAEILKSKVVLFIRGNHDPENLGPFSNYYCMKDYGYALRDGIHTLYVETMTSAPKENSILLQHEYISIDNSYKLILHGHEHKRYVKGNRSCAGSFMQRTVLEPLYSHGAIVWNLDDMSYEFIDVENKYLRALMKYEQNELYWYSENGFVTYRDNIFDSNLKYIRLEIYEYSIDLEEKILDRLPKVNIEVVAKTFNGLQIDLSGLSKYATEDILREYSNPSMNFVYMRWKNVEPYLDNVEHYINFTDLDNVTILYGDNNTGKSSVLNLVTIALYGREIKYNNCNDEDNKIIRKAEYIEIHVQIKGKYNVFRYGTNFKHRSLNKPSYEEFIKSFSYIKNMNEAKIKYDVNEIYKINKDYKLYESIYNNIMVEEIDKNIIISDNIEEPENFICDVDYNILMGVKPVLDFEVINPDPCYITKDNKHILKNKYNVELSSDNYLFQQDDKKMEEVIKTFYENDLNPSCVNCCHRLKLEGDIKDYYLMSSVIKKIRSDYSNYKNEREKLNRYLSAAKKYKDFLVENNKKRTDKEICGLKLKEIKDNINKELLEYIRRFECFKDIRCLSDNMGSFYNEALLFVVKIYEKKPNIFFVDEGFSGVNESNVKDVFKLLDNQNFTKIIFITHNKKIIDNYPSKLEIARGVTITLGSLMNEKDLKYESSSIKRSPKLSENIALERIKSFNPISLNLPNRLTPTINMKTVLMSIYNRYSSMPNKMTVNTWLKRNTLQYKNKTYYMWNHHSPKGSACLECKINTRDLVCDTCESNYNFLFPSLEHFLSGAISTFDNYKDELCSNV